jgi:hypothetical protein
MEHKEQQDFFEIASKKFPDYFTNVGSIRTEEQRPREMERGRTRVVHDDDNLFALLQQRERSFKTEKQIDGKRYL